MDLPVMPPLLDEPAATAAPAGFVRRAIRATLSGLDWLFGLVSLLLGLAILSIVPVLNFLSLGYLIHASGQVAATGKLRAGFIGVLP